MGIVIIFLVLLLVSFIPIIISFKKKTTDKTWQKAFTVTYLIYLFLFLLFGYLVLFKDLSFGNGLGDMFLYILFTFLMLIINLGMGLRNKIGKGFKLFFILINIISSIYLIQSI